MSEDPTDNEARNLLTEAENSYKQINPAYWACLAGLGNLSPLSQVILISILGNKFYGSRVGVTESTRIYNTSYQSADVLLKNLYPGKYNDNGRFESGRDVFQDHSNIRKKIKDLDENNIFYFWNYDGSYIFFMERDIGSWKIYNPSGVVTPKTIKKIINSVDGIIEAMALSVGKTGRSINRENIRHSLGKFIDRLIKKCDKSVSCIFPDFDKSVGLHKYIEETKMTIEKIDNYEGLTEDATFRNRLPMSVSGNLVKMQKKKTKEDKEIKSVIDTPPPTLEKSSEASLMDDLIPKNGNLCKNKGVAAKKSISKPKKNIARPPRESDSTMEILGYGNDLDPFSSAPCLVQFCWACIRTYSGTGPNFESIDSAVADAGKILDTLIEINRSQDREFLRSWMESYVMYELKGNKSQNKKYTSMQALSKNLPKYNEKYYLPN